MLFLYLYIIYLISAFAGGFAGFSSWIRIEKLSKQNLLNAILITLFFFTLLMAAYLSGVFPQPVAAPFMAAIYSFLAGFFGGYAARLITLRTNAGIILYTHQSFWVDHAPNLLSLVIILFGLYRSALLTSDPVTDIRLTSGISLICFGFLGWTIKLIPDFRSKGILLFDKKIPWQQVISWHWYSENILMIEYISDIGEINEGVKEFLTSIPENERLEIETILKSKMDEHTDQRQKLLLKSDE